MKKVILERIHRLPCMGRIAGSYKKHQEIVRYLFFGGIAVILNFVLFIFFLNVCRLNVLYANAMSWILCVLFQFFTNRRWVFESAGKENGGVFRQLLSFAAGRLFTLACEEMILIIFIHWLGLPTLRVKLAGQVVTIVLNYVISKWVIFRRR